MSRGRFDCMLRRTPSDEAHDTTSLGPAGVTFRSTTTSVYSRKLSDVGRVIAVDDLVDAAAVASMLGLKHKNSVATYLHRYQDFPRPVVDTESGRCRLWSRTDVQAWIQTSSHSRRRGVDDQAD